MMSFFLFLHDYFVLFLFHFVMFDKALIPFVMALDLSGG